MKCHFVNVQIQNARECSPDSIALCQSYVMNFEGVGDRNVPLMYHDSGSLARLVEFICLHGMLQLYVVVVVAVFVYE